MDYVKDYTIFLLSVSCLVLFLLLMSEIEKNRILSLPPDRGMILDNPCDMIIKDNIIRPFNDHPATIE